MGDFFEGCLTNPKHHSVPVHFICPVSPFCLCPSRVVMGQRLMCECVLDGQNNCSKIWDPIWNEICISCAQNPTQALERYSCQMEVQQMDVLWQKFQNQSWFSSSQILQSCLTLSGLFSPILKFLYLQMMVTMLFRQMEELTLLMHLQCSTQYLAMVGVQ